MQSRHTHLEGGKQRGEPRQALDALRACWDTGLHAQAVGTERISANVG